MTIAKKYEVPKKFFDGPKIFAGLALFVLVLAIPAVYTSASGGEKSRPALKLPQVADAKDCPPGELCGCVEDVDYMRSYHMDLLNQWRDSAVRDGRRLYVSDRWGASRPIEMSLSNTCLSSGCHQSKVDFCDQCHNWAGVDPYCWDCHVVPGEEK